jgi:hypothetical protein
MSPKQTLSVSDIGHDSVVPAVTTGMVPRGASVDGGHERKRIYESLLKLLVRECVKFIVKIRMPASLQQALVLHHPTHTAVDNDSPIHTLKRCGIRFK